MGRLLVLASASPQRSLLLKKLRVPFRVVSSDVSEKSPEKNPRRLVVLLALRKARAVARLHPEALVLGADTLVVCRGQILGKPRNKKDAEKILRLLNGSWQRVYTGVALALGEGKKTFTEVGVTKLLARRLDEEKLRGLIGKHMDKAGAYAVQDRRDPFIKKIVGDRDNAIGLPLRLVRRLLARAHKAK